MDSAVHISKGDVDSQLLQPLSEGKQADVGQSIVMVDSPSGFEDAWEKALQQNS
jgi:hypothetical protein